jgi:hypothetical protein
MFYLLFYRDVSNRTRAVLSVERGRGEPGESSGTS